MANMVIYIVCFMIKSVLHDEICYAFDLSCLWQIDSLNY